MGVKRTYHQFCGLAAALDVVGERWTLLIIRELLVGPRRYSDLLTDLPGLGTNLLADRLRFLVEQGVVRPCGGPGSGERRAYELTEVGLELRTAVLGLARWGLEFVGDLSAEDVVRPHWGYIAVQAMLRAEPAPVASEDHEFHVDEDVFHIAVRDHHAVVRRGPAAAPTTVFTTDAATFVRIGSRRLAPLAALGSGALRLTGDPAAALRCCELLGLAAGQPEAGADVTAGAPGEVAQAG